MQLNTSQIEANALSEQLKAARQQSQQYCDIAESAETQLRELTAEYNKCKEELENALKESRVEIISLQKRVKELGDDLAKISNGRQETDSELRDRLIEAERKVEELDELKGELELLKNDLKSVSIAAKEAEDKYAREMMQHSADLQVSLANEEIHLYKFNNLFLYINVFVDFGEVERGSSERSTAT